MPNGFETRPTADEVVTVRFRYPLQRKFVAVDFW
jgi:hypothetical protein